MIAKDIKRGHIVNYQGAPCMIETINVQSPSARGAATFYKYRARNLITKQKVDITLRGGESLAEAPRMAGSHSTTFNATAPGNWMPTHSSL